MRYKVTKESTDSYNKLRENNVHKTFSREEIKNVLANEGIPMGGISLCIFIKQKLILRKKKAYTFSRWECTVPELANVMGEIRNKGRQYCDTAINKKSNIILPNSKTKIDAKWVANWITTHPNENLDLIALAFVKTSMYNLSRKIL